MTKVASINGAMLSLSWYRGSDTRGLSHVGLLLSIAVTLTRVGRDLCTDPTSTDTYLLGVHGNCVT